VTAPPRETQPERTALAWQRTGLGVLGVAVLLGHGAVQRSRPALLVVAGAVALLGLALLGGVGPLRYRRLRAAVPGPVAAPRAAAAAAGVVVATAAAAVAAVFTLR
jgi:putative membrane protein